VSKVHNGGRGVHNLMVTAQFVGMQICSQAWPNFVRKSAIPA